ncbi:hypothetical protein [Streptomyces sp. NPDC088358]|uniref:hypothetical protein n=1 Tax=Streptomyces sp. NPDC088358 TaxID=3365857 RepID=UPI0037F799FD
MTESGQLRSGTTPKNNRQLQKQGHGGEIPRRRDGSVMFDLAEKPGFAAASEKP